MANDKQPSFAERAETMRVAANNLVATSSLIAQIAKDVETEAALMAAAVKRFSERRADTRKPRR